jgi:hypothetical protein
MEGLTHDDAAHRLRWPLGTVKGRLARAKDLLRKRLTRRGFTMSEATFAKAICGPDAVAAVPLALTEATFRAAAAISSDADRSLAAYSKISMPVAALAEGVLQAMKMTKVISLTLPLLLVGAVTSGVVVLAAQGNSKEKKGGSDAELPAKSADPQNASQPGPASDRGPSSTTDVLRDQLKADQELYESLVVPGRMWSENDFRGLVRWSVRLLEASRTISSSPQGRKAAYTAHRDRMKRLNALAGNSSPSDAIKAMTDAQLKEAEVLLNSVPEDGNRPALNISSPVGSPIAGRLAGLPGEITKAAESNAQAGDHSPGGRAMVEGGGTGEKSGNATDMSFLRSTVAAFSAELAHRDKDPRSQQVRKKLDEYVSMSFANPTPLEDILKYIKQASTSPTSAGIPIYVDPKGLAETANTLTSTVTIDLEGVPLKTTLRLALKQLGLAYCVRDGVLIISSVQGINDELAEERSEFEAANQQK